MKKLITTLITVSALVLTGCSNGSQGDTTTSDGNEFAGNKVMLYSSMQEDQLQAIKNGFEAKYPDIEMDYYFAGTGKVITKITTEHQSGQVAADLVWVGDPADYIGFKNEGILAKYSSPESDHIDAKFIDPENYYTGARMMNMSIGYNTSLVDESEAPTNWEDLLDEKWHGQIVMTDPASAGTTKYFVGSMLKNDTYGTEFFEKLKANGCELESGTTATHNQVAAGAYKVGVMLDYVSNNLIKEGSPIGFKYVSKDLVSIYSPIGLIEGCANEENGKKLYDFILSKEGQEILVKNNLISVRDDVDQQGVDVDKITGVAMDVSIDKLAGNSEEIISTFDEIFK